jgi:hypothetical protein
LGSYLSFIAFDHEPRLAAVRGLMDYRLFKRDGRDEWYLEGQGKDADAISRFELPTIDKARFGAAWGNAKREYQALAQAVQRHGRKTSGLDYVLIPLALALSNVLQTRLLVVSANDEDLDCAFICSHGRLIRGQFYVDAEEKMTFDVESGSHIVAVDWTEGRLLYGLASEVAADYFKGADADTHNNEWQEWPPTGFQLVDQRKDSLARRTGNQAIGCAVLALGFFALMALFSIWGEAAWVVGPPLLIAALVWHYWPQRRRR